VSCRTPVLPGRVLKSEWQQPARPSHLTNDRFLGQFPRSGPTGVHLNQPFRVRGECSLGQPNERPLSGATRTGLNVANDQGRPHAYGLSSRAAANSHVEKNRLKIRNGEKLSPLLSMRNPATGQVIIADGYHRLCSIYRTDEDASTPSQIVCEGSDAIGECWPNLEFEHVIRPAPAFQRSA
jgi:hypothetical protein